MPVKARYWENPELHRKEVRDRRRRLHALGLKRSDYSSPEARKRYLQHENNYHKAHRATAREVDRRYFAKIRKLFGSTSKPNRWRFHMLRQEQNAKLKKLRAKSITIYITPLSRKLVAHKK